MKLNMRSLGENWSRLSLVAGRWGIIEVSGLWSLVAGKEIPRLLSPLANCARDDRNILLAVLLTNAVFVVAQQLCTRFFREAEGRRQKSEEGAGIFWWDAQG